MNRLSLKLTIVALFTTLGAGNVQALGIEEFDYGAGGWDISPRKISRTSTPGWVVVERDGENAITNSLSPTQYGYNWKLTRSFDLANTKAPVFEFKFEFVSDEYESFRIQIGDANARRNSDFEDLYTSTEPGGIVEGTIDLSDYNGEKIKIRLLLKKASNIVVSESGVFVYRAGIAFPDFNSDNQDDPDSLLIAAFNVQVFGKSKMKKDNVLENLVAILSRYDLILFQEIRDSSGTAFDSLMSSLNSATNGQYEMTISDRLGRSSSKEQYAYIYKSAKLKLNNTYHFDDGVEPRNDTFEREPYIAHFESIAHGYDFTLVGIHTSPKKAFQEIDGLLRVYEDAKQVMEDDDVILLGDLNASCNYVRASRIESLLLRQDSRFTWHIDDDADTTTSATNCAYDRFVTTGTTTNRVQPTSAQVFYFDQAYSLDSRLTKQVSDHYPVELRLDIAD